MKKVILIGDSYGTPRTPPCQEVSLEETWPQLLTNEFDGVFESDFKTFRCLIECVEILEKKETRYDVVVIGAGCVDIFPRTLPYQLSRSQFILLKLFRVFVRSIRKWWAKNIYWKPWFSHTEVETAIIKALDYCDHLVLHTASPMTEKHDAENPGGQKILDDFNEFLLAKEKEFPEKIICFDVAKVIRQTGVETCLDPNDSHFNVKGNAVIAKAIKPIISRLISA